MGHSESKNKNYNNIYIISTPNNSHNLWPGPWTNSNHHQVKFPHIPDNPWCLHVQHNLLKSITKDFDSVGKSDPGDLKSNSARDGAPPCSVWNVPIWICDFLRFGSLPWSSISAVWRLGWSVAPITPRSTPDSHHSGPLRLQTSSWSKIETHPPTCLNCWVFWGWGC